MKSFSPPPFPCTIQLSPSASESKLGMAKFGGETTDLNSQKDMPYCTVLSNATVVAEEWRTWSSKVAATQRGYVAIYLCLKKSSVGELSVTGIAAVNPVVLLAFTHIKIFFSGSQLESVKKIRCFLL